MSVDLTGLRYHVRSLFDSGKFSLRQEGCGFALVLYVRLSRDLHTPLGHSAASRQCPQELLATLWLKPSTSSCWGSPFGLFPPSACCSPEVARRGSPHKRVFHHRPLLGALVPASSHGLSARSAGPILVWGFFRAWPPSGRRAQDTCLASALRAFLSAASAARARNCTSDCCTAGRARQRKQASNRQASVGEEISKPRRSEPEAAHKPQPRPSRSAAHSLKRQPEQTQQVKHPLAGQTLRAYVSRVILGQRFLQDEAPL